MAVNNSDRNIWWRLDVVKGPKMSPFIKSQFEEKLKFCGRLLFKMTQLKILDDLENLKFYEKAKIGKKQFCFFFGDSYGHQCYKFEWWQWITFDAIENLVLMSLKRSWS